MADTADDALRARLETAAEGLFFTSEADHPFTWVRSDAAGPPTPEAAAALAGRPGEPVQEVSLERLFRPHLHPGAGDPVSARLVPRYEALRAALEAGLTDLRVYRVGSVNLTVLIVGTAPSGHLAGLRTEALET